MDVKPTRRDFLAGASGASVGLVPEPATKEHLERVRDVASRLRHGYPERYVALATQVEDDFKLRQATIDAQHLGRLAAYRLISVL